MVEVATYLREQGAMLPFYSKKIRDQQKATRKEETVILHLITLG